VYNQAFVKDTLHVADGLKGIFNLSGENKTAEEKIATAPSELRELREDREPLRAIAASELWRSTARGDRRTGMTRAEGERRGQHPRRRKPSAGVCAGSTPRLSATAPDAREEPVEAGRSPATYKQLETKG
jgi:hypothetical protein